MNEWMNAIIKQTMRWSGATSIAVTALQCVHDCMIYAAELDNAILCTVYIPIWMAWLAGNSQNFQQQSFLQAWLTTIVAAGEQRVLWGNDGSAETFPDNRVRFLKKDNIVYEIFQDLFALAW